MDQSCISGSETAVVVAAADAAGSLAVAERKQHDWDPFDETVVAVEVDFDERENGHPDVSQANFHVVVALVHALQLERFHTHKSQTLVVLGAVCGFLGVGNDSVVGDVCCWKINLRLGSYFQEQCYLQAHYQVQRKTLVFSLKLQT